MKSQQKIWNNIAEEWNEFRKEPMPEVVEFLKNKKGKILDAGCGSGRHLIASSNLKFYCVDFSEKMINLTKRKAKKIIALCKSKDGSTNSLFHWGGVGGGWRRNYKPSQKNPEINEFEGFFVSDLANLPFKNNFFDCAICISALHCIEKKENRKKSLEELFRVLKLDAEALISVWNKNSNWFKNPKKENYIRWKEKGKRYYYLYEINELKTLLEETGFKIVKNWSEKNIFFIVSKKLKVG